MQRILLPTDFSDNSFHAAQYAAQLLGTAHVEWTLLHTYLDADPSVSSWAGMAEELFKAAMQGMEQWEQRIRKTDLFADAKVATQVVYGPLPAVLDDLAGQKGADLVVMGTQGRSGAGILGSNAAAVVKNSHCPVLVVPAKARLGSPGKILFADDQRGVEVEGTRMLLHIALRDKAEVVLAHVLRSKDELPDAELVAMYNELLQAIPHRFISEEGKDVAGVIDFLARKEHAGMIAVLHRHTGFFEGLFRPSTAKRLALHTDIPLLVLQDHDRK